MKFIRFLGVLWLLIPCVSAVAGTADFQNASKLLVAARRGDTQTVQALINAGVDVNYTDATGLSLVCTAVMNNDRRAIQVLQMYGADASNCDKQIKQYNQKTRVAAKGEEYGFFSGLSSTHVIALSALGVAAVIGGVVLLADVFDKDNDNGSNGSTGDRPNNNGGSDSSSTSTTKLFNRDLPYGPGCTSTDCSEDYELLESYLDFAYMSNTSIQDTFNYLMVARAYHSFVRGYLGMGTIRLSTDLSPFDLSSLPYPVGGVPGGGQPVNVAMVTASGVNATGSAVDGLISWADAAQIANAQSICNINGDSSEACQTFLSEQVTKTSHKYYNYSGTSAAETENTAFDLSGSGSVFGSATDEDTKLAKIIAGWEEGGRSADFYGFIPNGQLSVYKTGTGNVWAAPTTSSVTGSYSMGTSVAVDDTFTLANGTVLTVASVSGNNFVATNAGNTYHGYIDGDNMYIDSKANGVINQMYVMGAENALTLTQELTDYRNYTAMYDAIVAQSSGSYVSNVIANLYLPSAATNLDYATVGYADSLYKAVSTEPLKKAVYLGFFNKYYNLNTSDDSNVYTLPSGAVVSGSQSLNAGLVFERLGNYQSQILVNPAGRTLYNVISEVATFENFAPVVYPDLENLFMTVVAVRPKNATGTSGETIDGYSAANVGTLELSTWDDVDDASISYSSRICGLTGTGNGGAMNPWCFAAPGVTDLEATAAMAGSVALVQSAFTYMTPKQVFLLLALTADGPYLGTNPATGGAWASTDALIGYLQELYTLPGVNISSNDYLENFKNAFGYGMINLERATKPGTNVYFYSSDTDTIVSSSGKNAYWRNASGSLLRASSALSLTNRGAINVSFFDVLESSDGSISLPRVWNTSFAENNTSKHGLYMGDVLADFNVDSTNKRTNQIGNMTIDMALSPRAYNDNLNGLDNLRIAFGNEEYDLDAEYQHYLTDGESRFNGRANGVLALVSNSVTTGAKYKYGNFAFGGRAFSGAITDEQLLENDPVISSQYEPGRLGLATGAAMNTEYNSDSFTFNVSVGNLHETNTVLGMYSDGLLTMRGGDTRYIDVVTEYKPFENVKLSARGTFANTRVDTIDGIISDVSDIKSNAFALGADVGGFSFTAAMPLVTVGGKMGYSYAEFSVVENDGNYEIAMNNPHIEYIDLAKQKRELRFSSSYRHSLGEFTDAGVGFIYRVNPNNTDVFGNESVFMFKLHHRLGI